MLNVMRENLRHLKPILWVVAASMVAYLGAYFSCDRDQGGVDAPWVARVDGTAIPSRLFLRLAQQRDENYRQMLGDQYDRYKAQLAVGRQTAQSLIDQQIILLEADKLGLSASKHEVSQRIFEDPSLKGPDGKFIGKAQYEAVVSRSFEGGVAGYERQIANSIVVQKWVDLVTSPVHVGDAELLAMYREQNDRTAVDYVVVASAKQKFDSAVSDGDIQSWYDAHNEELRVPEGREIRFVTVKRQDLLAKVQVTDDQVQQYYEQNRTEFSRPEQRRASHILIRVAPDATPEQVEAARKKAEEIRSRAVGGQSFEELARTSSEDKLSAERGGDLGFFGKGSMVPDFEKAVWDTPVGQIAPVTRTPFGFHVIQVTGERPAGTAPLEEVRKNIEEQLRRRAADDMTRTEAQRIRDAASGVDALDQAAAKEGVSVQDAVLRRNTPVPGLDASPDILATVFDLEPGKIAGPLAVRQGWAVIGVVKMLPSAIPPLDEVHDKVSSQILNQRGREAALRSARRALQKYGTVAKVAKALDLDVQKSGNIATGAVLPKTGGTTPDLEHDLFGPDSEKGKTGVAPVPAGAVVFEITERQVFDQAKYDQAKKGFRDQVLDQRRNALIADLLDKLRETHRVEINDALIKQVDT